ncbi:MAG: hypothetical protein QOI23_956, partial [Chloroflexota bacterium]|nr:hypothetical protein [Chloroflexota bacterium]
MKLLPRILADEADEDRRIDAAESLIRAEPERQDEPHLGWWWTPIIAIAAALPRLIYLFVLTDPENPGVRRYGDVWHHWQIA